MIGAMLAMLLSGGAQTYEVRAEMRRDEQVIAAPRLSVREGRAASIAVAGRYEMRMLVVADAKRPGGLVLSPDLLVIDGDSRRRVTTSVAVRPGEVVRLTMPAMDGAPDTAIDVAISATPVDG